MIGSVENATNTTPNRSTRSHLPVQGHRAQQRRQRLTRLQLHSNVLPMLARAGFFSQPRLGRPPLSPTAPPHAPPHLWEGGPSNRSLDAWLGRGRVPPTSAATGLSGPAGHRRRFGVQRNTGATVLHGERNQGTSMLLVPWIQ